MLSNEHKEKLYPLFRSHSLEDVRQATTLLESIPFDLSDLYFLLNKSEQDILEDIRDWAFSLMDYDFGIQSHNVETVHYRSSWTIGQLALLNESFVKEIKSFEYYDLEYDLWDFSCLRNLNLLSLAVHCPFFEALSGFDVLSSWHNLEVISIWNNDLSHFDFNVPYFPNVQEADFGECTLPPFLSLNNFPQLTTFCGERSKGLDEIQISRGLPTLKEMILFDNSICRLANDFAEYTPALERLDLRRTKLAKLPDSLTSLDTLQYLSIAHTSITTLPFTHKGPSHLCISGDQWNVLAPYIVQIKSLQRLTIVNIQTALKDFASRINTMSQLEILDLRFDVNFGDEDSAIHDHSMLECINGLQRISHLQELWLTNPDIFTYNSQDEVFKSLLMRSDSTWTRLSLSNWNPYNLPSATPITHLDINISTVKEQLQNGKTFGDVFPNVTHLSFGGIDGDEYEVGEVGTLLDSLNQCSKLEYLDISLFDCSSGIPKSLLTLTNLHTLHIGYLVKDGYGCILDTDLQQLQTALPNCNIHILPEDTFHPISKMYHIVDRW